MRQRFCREFAIFELKANLDSRLQCRCQGCHDSFRESARWFEHETIPAVFHKRDNAGYPRGKRITLILVVGNFVSRPVAAFCVQKETEQVLLLSPPPT